jgi:hypothetical protein
LCLNSIVHKIDEESQIVLSEFVPSLNYRQYEYNFCKGDTKITQFDGVFLKIYRLVDYCELNTGDRFVYYNEDYLINDPHLSISIKQHSFIHYIMMFINYLIENNVKLVIILNDSISNLYNYRTTFFNKGILLIKVLNVNIAYS